MPLGLMQLLSVVWKNMNLNKCDTNLDTKQKHIETFFDLIRNQGNHGGQKYALNDQKEFSDVICECFGGESGVDWILGNILKYSGRYKNFGREKDLLKIAMFSYILWIKGGFHLNQNHDEDVKI